MKLKNDERKLSPIMTVRWEEKVIKCSDKCVEYDCHGRSPILPELMLKQTLFNGYDIYGSLFRFYLSMSIVLKSYLALNVIRVLKIFYNPLY